MEDEVEDEETDWLRCDGKLCKKWRLVPLEVFDQWKDDEKGRGARTQECFRKLYMLPKAVCNPPGRLQ